MPQFANLTDAQLEDIRDYLRARAKQAPAAAAALKAGKPEGPKSQAVSGGV